jgi:O-antigen/teichoic acid export membrane protein
MIEDTKPFLYNYLHLVLGKALGFSVMGFISLLLIVRMLSSADYGSYALFISVASVVAVVTTWTSASIVRFGREEFITEGSVKKTFWANYGILLPAFAICLFLIFIFRARLSDYIGISQDACYLIFGYILLSNLSLNISVAFQAMGKMKHFSYLPLVSSGSFLAALAIIYFMSISVSIELVISLLILGHLLVSIIGLWLLRKDITPIYFSRDWIKRCFSYSWPLLFGSTSGVVVHNIDQIVIRAFMSLSFVGIYNVAYQLQGYLIMFPMLSVSLMFPLMTSLVITNSESKIKWYKRVYSSQITFLWALVISVFIVLASLISWIFGADYAAAVFPLNILLLGVAFQIITVVNSPVLSAHGLMKETAVINIIMAAMNLGLDILLIPLLGINGAAIATAAVLTLGAIGYSLTINKRLRINDFASYAWLFPAIISFAGSVFINGLAYRAIFLVVVVILSILVAKRSTIFNMESLAILDSIDMPAFVRRMIKRVYSILI